MAIYGIGAYYHGDTDVSKDFIKNNFVGTGWSIKNAPELHNYFKTLKIGDIVYIKAAFGGSKKIVIKAIGIIKDDEILTTKHHHLTVIGRNVKWVNTNKFSVVKPNEKNNVRSNTVYEEFHPVLQAEIISKF